MPNRPPEEMTLVELAEKHPDEHIRRLAKAVIDIVRDKTPQRTTPSLRESTSPPH